LVTAGGDVGDGADLRREVRGEQVDVGREVLPGAGRAGDVRLTAEAPLDADLAGHGGHLIGEGREGVRHAVDGVGERRDFALRFDRQRLVQVAVGDGGHDLHDAAHLVRQVRRHDVDVVREALPRAGHALHLGLAAELALGADLARDARDLGGEGVELVDHRVDGLLELQHLAAHVDGDLARQVAVGDGRGDLGDVADLRREVAGHRVDVLVSSFHAPATPGTCAWPPSFPSVPTSRATRVTSAPNALSWSTIVLMVSLSWRISPRTSTVILRDRSPSAMAVATSAMLRTWAVRLPAIELTLSVRSFQTPLTPFTWA
jgi:hypothetical protein